MNTRPSTGNRSTTDLSGKLPIDYSRLQGDGRLTRSLDARHTDVLRQTWCRVLPDPDVPFDARANITGVLAVGEIDLHYPR